MKKTLEDKLKSLKFRNLAESESQDAWRAISARIVSRAFLLPAKNTNMIPLLIGILMAIGAGGTAVAANSAVPGDVLFPVDRAVENMRLAFSGKGKANLEVKFAEERLDEVQKLIIRSRFAASASTTVSTSSPQAATSTNKVNGRVAVGVNVAISYLNGISADLAASGNAEAAARIQSVIDRLETMVNDPDVKFALRQDGDFMLKIKESDDEDDDSETGPITNATSTASSTGKIKINTSGHKGRIEVKEENGKFKIEIKDNGEMKIKSETEVEIENDDNDNGHDDDRDRGEERKDRDDDDDDDNATTTATTTALRIRIR